MALDQFLAFLRLAFFVHHVGSENSSCFVILHRPSVSHFPTGQPLCPVPFPLIKTCFQSMSVLCHVVSVHFCYQPILPILWSIVRL